LAAVVGGTIQAWAARHFEVSRFERQNRNQAYLAYLNGIGRLSFADTPDAVAEAHARIAEARSKIALSGSVEVVERMVQVFRNGPDIFSQQARADLGALLAAMRTDSLAQGEGIQSSDLFELTFGAGLEKDLT
jgi:hypothetical protein